MIGRRTECHTLDLLVREMQSGQSRVLVVHGEAGFLPKTELSAVAIRRLLGMA